MKNTWINPYGYQEIDGYNSREEQFKGVLAKQEKEIQDNTQGDIERSGQTVEALEELSVQISGNTIEITKKADKEDLNEVSAKMSQLLTRIEVLETAQPNLKVASKPEDIYSITEPQNTMLVLTSKEAVESLTAQITYKEVAIVGANTDVTINVNANDKVAIDGLTINGGQDGGNGKINYATPSLDIKNVTITAGTTNYNVFEGTQNTTDTSLCLTELNAENINVDDVNLKHNVINIYTPKDNTVINIKNSYFNLNADNSNILRISNYLNASNVTINFENIDWTYENVETPCQYPEYAGLILYQKVKTDESNVSTWTINVKNCRYNGEPITTNEFRTIKQIGYTYINRVVGDLGDTLTLNIQ